MHQASYLLGSQSELYLDLTVLQTCLLALLSYFANEPAERLRSAGEAAENSATRRMLYAEKFSIDL